MDEPKGLNHQLSLNWTEYASFTCMLGLSALIGIYYGCMKGNQNTVSEYLLGGKSMSIFPIAMSLIVSHVSGITLIGIPSEIYQFGLQYMALQISVFLSSVTTILFFIPVFHKLQVTSLYEYLELRFSQNVRLIVSFIYAASVILYIPIIIYIPALAINQVTGISVHCSTPIICFLCIFYTSIGGLKAVVWADAVQGVFTTAALIAVIILGIKEFDGIYNILEISGRGGRLEMFNMDPNPFIRNTFWSVTIGSYFMWIVFIAINPGTAQRLIALPTIRQANWSVIHFTIGGIIVKILSGFIGLIVYAKYKSCNPIKTGVIKKSGQLLPLYVQEVARTIPGLVGLFTSGLVSAALSCMSAGINTLAGTIYEDFISKCMSSKTSEKKASLIMKIITVFIGIICTLLVFVVEKFDSIIEISSSFTGVTSGALLTTFILGLFIPIANSKGAICGMIASFVSAGWIILKAQLAVANGDIVYLGKPTSVDSCTYNFTIAVQNNISRLVKYGEGIYADENLNPMYRLSYMYYTVFGFVIGLTVGIIASYLTGPTDLKTLNPDLLAPIVRRILPKRKNKTENEYSQILQEMQITKFVNNINNDYKQIPQKDINDS